ncbi:hypothetical protein AKJ16_DCAP24224 [Drosera capensis]
MSLIRNNLLLGTDLLSNSSHSNCGGDLQSSTAQVQQKSNKTSVYRENQQHPQASEHLSPMSYLKTITKQSKLSDKLVKTANANTSLSKNATTTTFRRRTTATNGILGGLRVAKPRAAVEIARSLFLAQPEIGRVELENSVSAETAIRTEDFWRAVANSQQISTRTSRNSKTSFARSHRILKRLITEERCLVCVDIVGI